jgi:DNA-binding CsgD family transcriptional regulator
VAQAVRAAHKGKAWFSPQISHRLLQQSRNCVLSGRRQASAPDLSGREQEVMGLIANAKTNEQIAQELGISVKTVEKHRGSLMHKLDIHETATLTRFAIASGMVDVTRPALANDFPNRAQSREELRKAADDNRKLRAEQATLRAKLDVVMAEGKETKKKIPFRRREIPPPLKPSTGAS